MTEASNSKAIDTVALEMVFTSNDDESVRALVPTDLHIEAGEFVAIVGPSGCGKSTLLNILAGFVSATGGRATIGGEAITGPSIDHGVVFQDYALFPWLTVIENVTFGLKSRRMDRGERNRVAVHYLGMVGLADFANKRPSELSGGMKQRVAIARTFATDPAVILMDEPFGALDALTRRFLQQQLLAIWKGSGKTVFFVTHSVQEAVYLADRIIVMTSRPGSIKSDFRITLPHPRDFTSDGFRTHEKQVFDSLDEELAKTFGIAMEGLQSD